MSWIKFWQVEAIATVRLQNATGGEMGNALRYLPHQLVAKDRVDRDQVSASKSNV